MVQQVKLLPVMPTSTWTLVQLPAGLFPTQHPDNAPGKAAADDQVPGPLQLTIQQFTPKGA